MLNIIHVILALVAEAFLIILFGNAFCATFDFIYLYIILSICACVFFTVLALKYEIMIYRETKDKTDKKVTK